jgi:hypothetical protein
MPDGNLATCFFQKGVETAPPIFTMGDQERAARLTFIVSPEQMAGKAGSTEIIERKQFVLLYTALSRVRHGECKITV